MISRLKSLAALAAVLAAGITLGVFIPHAIAVTATNGLGDNGVALNGLGDNGVALNRMLFDFNAVSVEDVQFPAVSSK